MMEMTIKVEAPSLAAAIEKLAAAITPSSFIPDEPHPVVAPPAAPVAPVAPPAAVTPTTAPSAAVSAPAPVPVASTPPVGSASHSDPAPAVPVTTAPTYTLDQIAKAGAALVDAGKMEQLLALLGKYGVAAVTQLSPEQYGNFATELRALGAQI